MVGSETCNCNREREMNEYGHFTKTGTCAKCGKRSTVIVAVDADDFPVMRAMDNVSDSVRWICRECVR